MTLYVEKRDPISHTVVVVQRTAVDVVSSRIKIVTKCAADESKHCKKIKRDVYHHKTTIHSLSLYRVRQRTRACSNKKKARTRLRAQTPLNNPVHEICRRQFTEVSFFPRIFFNRKKLLL